MNFVFRINEDLAGVSVSAIELLSVTRALSKTIPNKDTRSLLHRIIAEINKSFGVVHDSFAPFYQIDSEAVFMEKFDQCLEDFKSNYLLDVSKPRKFCDNVYDNYIQLQHCKEFKSSFPILKRNFERLETHYDKWISNDNFLGLAIDGVLKQKNLLLSHIAERKPKDEEDAWLIFQSAFEDFRCLLDCIEENSKAIAEITAS